MRPFLRPFLACALLALLSACGGAPPPPPVPPTVVNATITATTDVNADTAGQGNPVAIRVYQLGSATAFKASTFFPLFEKDSATLKDDLVKREDILLGPGQSRTLVLTPDDRVHAIGVFAAYRDGDHVAWHDSVAVPPHQTSALTVMAGRAGLELSIAPVKAPAK